MTYAGIWGQTLEKLTTAVYFLQVLVGAAGTAPDQRQCSPHATDLMALQSLPQNPNEAPKKSNGPIAREIILNNADTIRNQLSRKVNFPSEQLLIFSWTGSGDDKLSFEIKETKEGSMVEFRLEPGGQKNKVGHLRYYAMQRDAKWQKPRNDRVRQPLIIGSLEELNKAFQDKKWGKQRGRIN
jgi:hypothetical protein